MEIREKVGVVMRSLWGALMQGHIVNIMSIEGKLYVWTRGKV